MGLARSAVGAVQDTPAPPMGGIYCSSASHHRRTARKKVGAGQHHGGGDGATAGRPVPRLKCLYHETNDIRDSLPQYGIRKPPRRSAVRPVADRICAPGGHRSLRACDLMSELSRTGGAFQLNNRATPFSIQGGLDPAPYRLRCAAKGIGIKVCISLCC